MHYLKITYPPILTEMTKTRESPCYYPNAHGSWTKAAINPVGLLYNDVEGWCIIQCDELPEGAEDGTALEEMTEVDALAIVNSNVADLANNKLAAGVHVGDELAHRWDNKPTAYCRDLIIDFNGKTFPKPLKYSNDLKSGDSKPLDLPKYLVKNLKKLYLEKFRDTGEVLISSIGRFRSMGGSGQDEKEGIKNTDICIDVEGPKEFKATDLGRFISYFKMEGTGSIEINGKIIIKDNTILPDVYVFCASHKAINDFGGANYKIVNVRRFAQTLFESIRKLDKEVYYWMMSPVIYGSAKDPVKTLNELKRLVNYNVNVATMLDCFYKASSFAEEEEFRFVFFTKKQPIEQTITIRNMNLAKCCRFEE